MSQCLLLWQLGEVGGVAAIPRRLAQAKKPRHSEKNLTLETLAKIAYGLRMSMRSCFRYRARGTVC